MGISKEQLKIASDYLSQFTVDQVAEVKEITENISIAQKTVNTRGAKELLSSPVVYNTTIATVLGNAVQTIINQDIILTSSILDYDTINIQLAINSTTRFSFGRLNSFDISQIGYNDSNDANIQNGSLMYILYDKTESSNSSFGNSSLSLIAWFKNDTTLHIYSVHNPINSAEYNKISIYSIKGIKLNPITIDPVEYINTTQGIEDAPVGNVISMMGKTAPKHHLICDGSVYNIIDYPHLVQYFFNQFGSYSIFGGDGTTTFAVPDMRDEFIRGYHGSKVNGLSGEPGIHQKPTSHVNLMVSTDSHIFMNGNYNNQGVTAANDYEDVQYSTNLRGWSAGYTVSNWAGDGKTTYTARPTNVSVLFCIKYEPTYFMSVQGLVEETTLWSGSKILPIAAGVTTVNDTLMLSDSIFNYDEIRFQYCWHKVSENLDAIKEQKRYLCADAIVNNTLDAFHISLGYSYRFNAAMRLTANNTIFIPQTFGENVSNTTGNAIKIYKIVGIKYKTW